MKNGLTDNSDDFYFLVILLTVFNSSILPLCPRTKGSAGSKLNFYKFLCFSLKHCDSRPPIIGYEKFHIQTAFQAVCRRGIQEQIAFRPRPASVFFSVYALRRLRF
jgi:hypothetical protein